MGNIFGKNNFSSEIAVFKSLFTYGFNTLPNRKITVKTRTPAESFCTYTVCPFWNNNAARKPGAIFKSTFI